MVYELTFRGGFNDTDYRNRVELLSYELIPYEYLDDYVSEFLRTNGLYLIDKHSIYIETNFNPTSNIRIYNSYCNSLFKLMRDDKIKKIINGI